MSGEWGYGIAQLKALREAEGSWPPTITDEWLVLIGQPDGRGKAFSMTLRELREYLASEKAS